ncbi:MAG TPA: TylF/MycF/NovP-related O-methyltransferase, partial [Enhygromyxa sp.]|nr:TylF/MycF/NovP-related O-methyltransferase [Enhygromyxa sp.]
MLLPRLRRRVSAAVNVGLDNLSRLIPDAGLRDKPIAEWTRLEGRLHGIRVPRSMGAKPPGPEGTANINIIFDLLARTRDVPGDVAECGVFRGETLLAIGLRLAQARPPVDKRVLGFDSFEGFDEQVEVDKQLGGERNVYKEVGGLSETSYDQLLYKVRRWGLSDRVELVPGYFNDTLQRHADRRFSFVHLDCDLYESYKTCLEFFYPRLSPGAIVL